MTFDPFMYLSVPIPIRNEKMVAVVLLPRIRTRDIMGSEGDRAEGDVAGTGERQQQRWLVTSFVLRYHAVRMLL